MGVLSGVLQFIPGYDFAGLASPILGMLFPIYQSMRALEQKKREQETQWLMYWICFATINFLETVAGPVLNLVPLYRWLRVMLLGWLAMPHFKGATMVYRLFVRPFLLALAEKARRVPAMEPYVRDFTRAAKEEPPPVTLEGSSLPWRKQA